MSNIRSSFAGIPEYAFSAVNVVSSVNAARFPFDKIDLAIRQFFN